MNNQITLAYLDCDDLDALQVVSVVSFYESFIDGADPLDMQVYLQTQLTTEILAVELAQPTSKFIGIKGLRCLPNPLPRRADSPAISWPAVVQACQGTTPW